MIISIYSFFLDINNFSWLRDLIIICLIFGIFIFFINLIKKIYYKSENISFKKKIGVKENKIILLEQKKYETKKQGILKEKGHIVKRPKRYNKY